MDEKNQIHCGNGKLLKVINENVKETHEKVVRVEEKLVNLNDRVTKLDKNIDMVRTAQQQAGTEVALIQAENKRQNKTISGLHKKVEEVENNVGVVDTTGKMFIAKTTQTWKVIAIIAGTLVAIVTIVLGAAKWVL